MVASGCACNGRGVSDGRVAHQADVVLGFEDDGRAVCGDLRVEDGELSEGERHRLDHQRHQRELWYPVLGGDSLELVASRHQSVHAHLVAEGELRDGERGGHLGIHGLPNALDRFHGVLL